MANESDDVQRALRNLAAERTAHLDPVSGWLRSLGVPLEDLEGARLAVLGLASTYLADECQACKDTRITLNMRASEVCRESGGSFATLDELAKDAIYTSAQARLDACPRCTELRRLAAPEGSPEPRTTDYEQRLDQVVRALYPDLDPDDVEDERAKSQRRDFLARQKSAVRAGARVLFTCDRGQARAYVVPREKFVPRQPTEGEALTSREAIDAMLAWPVKLEPFAGVPFAPGAEAESVPAGAVSDGEAHEGDAGKAPFEVPRLGGLAGGAMPMPAYGERGDAGTRTPVPEQPAEDLVGEASVATFKATVAGGLRWLLSKVEDPATRAAQATGLEALTRALDQGAARLHDLYGRPLDAAAFAQRDFAGAPPLTTADELVAGEAAARAVRAKVGPSAGPPGFRRAPDGSWIAHGWKLEWLAGPPGYEATSGRFVREADGFVARTFDRYDELTDAVLGPDGVAIWMPRGGVGVPAEVTAARPGVVQLEGEAF